MKAKRIGGLPEILKTPGASPLARYSQQDQAGDEPPEETEETECLVVIETGDPQWDRARKIWDDCKQSFWEWGADMVLFGAELQEIKTRLGFVGSGRRKEKPHACGVLSSPPKTWDNWCREQLGISADTADRCINCWKAVRERGKAIGDDSAAFRLLGAPASERTEEDRRALKKIIETLINGDSQKELLIDWKITKLQEKKLGGDTSEHRKENLANLHENAAVLWKGAFGDLAKGARKILQFRNRQDLEKWLTYLPLVPEGDFCGLLRYREELARLLNDATQDMTAILDTMDRFIAAKHESEAATAKRSSRRKQQPTRE